MNSAWDERYRESGYAYGTEPNDFLVSVADKITGQHILSLAEGEGRNATWLAKRGFKVTAVDSSAAGLQKTRRLAAMNGLEVTTVEGDLAEYSIESNYWDAVVSIFAHLPTPVRQRLHQSVVSGLKPGGVLILEAYTPAQLNQKSGGPPTAELMMTLDALKQEFTGLEFEIAHELEREINEGWLHNGISTVVQVLATKPLI